MFHIFDAMDDRGFSGFFFDWPNGAFTVISGGGGWVTGDLCGGVPSVFAGCFEDEVAPSALIQGF